MFKNTILIVDDVEFNRDMLSEILETDYKIMMAEDGEQAIELIHENRDKLAAILLDLMMPKMNGYEVLRVLNTESILEDIPVLIISTEMSVNSEKECFEAGVAEFIHKPFDEQLVRTRVKNIVSLYLYKGHLEETVAKQTQTLRYRNTKLIECLGSVVESRSAESGDHIRRVAEYTKILADELSKSYPEYGLERQDVEVIGRASMLHDIGKIAIPDSILLKPGRFTPDEFEVMKTHSAKGADLIREMDDIWDEEYKVASYEIARHHHERYDGKGYPDGLTGDEIPIAAQIVSVADVYDALISKRCYKEPFGKQKAFEMITGGECGTFSPKLMDCFAKRIADFEETADRLADYEVHGL